MIRQFYLENEYGRRWGLNSPASGLLTKPSGLGYSMDASYAAIGHSFIRNYIKEKQQSISGTLIFGTESPYKACSNFIAYVNGAESLKLIYKTDAGEYYRNVDLLEVRKTEKTAAKVLECPVKFNCKSLFYSNRVDRFVVSRSEGELRWDFTWPARFNDYGFRRVVIENTGHVPAGFELEIYGYCENPSVIVTQNGKELSRVHFPTILQVGEKILYSSVDGNIYCYRVDERGVESNFSDSLDINNTNFFKLPVGDSQIEFTSDTGATNRTVMTIYRFYRAV